MYDQNGAHDIMNKEEQNVEADVQTSLNGTYVTISDGYLRCE